MGSFPTHLLPSESSRCVDMLLLMQMKFLSAETFTQTHPLWQRSLQPCCLLIFKRWAWSLCPYPELMLEHSIPFITFFFSVLVGDFLSTFFPCNNPYMGCFSNAVCHFSIIESDWNFQFDSKKELVVGSFSREGSILSLLCWAFHSSALLLWCQDTVSRKNTKLSFT